MRAPYAPGFRNRSERRRPLPRARRYWQLARAIQLGLEYDPEPPFRSGSPELADPELVLQVQRQFTDSRREHARALHRQ
jgi:hypothetical protein